VIDVLLVSTAVVSLFMLGGVTPDATRVTFSFRGEEVNANYVAATLVFPAVAAIALGPGRGAFGWWRLVAVAPIVVALFLTGSRGGGAALVCGVLLVAALRRRVGVRLAVGAVVLAALLPVVVPQSTVDRLLSRYSTAEQDRLSGRMDIWRVAIAMVEDRPLHGQAYGGFPDAFYHYMLTARIDPHFARMHARGNRAAHNIYLGILAELGVIGLGLLAAALIAHARALWRARADALRRRDEPTARLALALTGVFAALLVFGTTIDLLASKGTWMWLAMIQATACLALRAGGTPPGVAAWRGRR
jgi:O-antigen ligase